MRVAFGNRTEFDKTIARLKGKDSPEALREKQKALLSLLEEEMLPQSTQYSYREAYDAHQLNTLILTLYSHVLCALSQKKSDPMQNLDQLEKLVAVFKAKVSEEEQG